MTTIEEMKKLTAGIQEAECVVETTGTDVEQVNAYLMACPEFIPEAIRVMEQMAEALKNISVQKKSSEWDSEGDTEYAYDKIIDVARSGLAAFDALGVE